MRPTRPFVPFTPAVLFVAAAACGSVPDDPGARLIPAAGVIQGTVIYQGPRPCSSNGHIVGNAIVLVFDQANPPPPNGLAATAINFGDVVGDNLFASEPRYAGTDLYCPAEHGFTDTITASAPFAISPIDGGSYVIEAFFDSTGDFWPTFKIRDLPEQGDIGGGDIDTADALKTVNLGNPNYQPIFLPVDVGTPQPLEAGQTTPTYTIPASGFVTNNVVVTVGQQLGTTRPYFYPEGATVSFDSASGALSAPAVVEYSDMPATSTTNIPGTAETNANYEPILTIPQDLLTMAAPPPPSSASLTSIQAATNQFEAQLPHIKLVFGVSNGTDTESGSSQSTNEWPLATAPPLNLQLGSSAQSQGGFSVWQNAYFDPNLQRWLPLNIAEGVVPMLWPQVILSKLIDDDQVDGVPDPRHGNDPASLTPQGAPGAPVVIMQGITLLEAPQPNPLGGASQGDTIFNTALGLGTAEVLGGAYSSSLFHPNSPPATQPTVFTQDHIVVALRPAVICFGGLFDSPPVTQGTLVTPFSGGQQAGVSGGEPASIIPTDLLTNANTPQADSSALTGQPLTGLQTRQQVTNLVSAVQYGCLPKGRYAINVVYPDGQAWTVPNEAGACSGSEGTTQYGATPLTCSIKPRSVLYSQGNRAVVEIVGPTNPANCQSPGPGASATISAGVVPSGAPAPAVPSVCQVIAPTQ